MSDLLGTAYPKLATRLHKMSFASIPTPIARHSVRDGQRERQIWVKHDDATSDLYGGNKVRKLEYILQRATERGARRIATFGAVGSNHALATAILARSCGFECTCFLAHQKPTPNIPRTLNKHLQLGTEMLRWGGSVNTLELFRRYLQGRHTWVVPLGGTSWLGVVGFVNAGLELAAQIDDGLMVQPQRIYIANGTMGSVAGLALGLALAEKAIDIHAVRVADNRYTHPAVLARIMAKTATMLHRLDASIPADLSGRVRVVWRDEFFAGGYAAVDAATHSAVDVARKRFDLQLETTYTGKAFAALLADMRGDAELSDCLFWNTYNSAPLSVSDETPDTSAALPQEFMCYFNDRVNPG